MGSKESNIKAKVGSVVSLEFMANDKFIVNSTREGGMGVVYELVPLRPGNVWAMKTFHEHTDRQAFQRECEMWIYLASHPNIAHAVAYGIWRGQPAIVAEWYPSSLADVDVMKWRNQKILGVFCSVASALNYAFAESGLVHQDVKPANILLDSEEQAKLGDFGLSRCKVSGDEPSPPQTYGDFNRSGSVTATGGTPLYMAPELFGGARASVRTDVFSLGVTFFELLTGEHPFIDPRTPGRFTLALRTQPLKKVLKARGTGIAPLLDAIRQCLAIDPVDRPSDYSYLIGLLRSDQHANRPIAENGDSVERSVATAVLHRTHGNYEEASRLLQTQLKMHPGNPILLNALGVLRHVEGKPEEASRAFARATEVIAAKAGKWKGAPYPDPIMNLAGIAIANRRFEQAAEILCVAESWLEEKTKRAVFPEFGWLLLYRGEFSAAVDFLMTMLGNKTPVDEWLWWITECGWLAGEMERIAGQIATSLLSVHIRDLRTAVVACLVAEYCTSNQSNELGSRVKQAFGSEILALERDHGLRIRPPIECAAKQFIIRSIDQQVTGGKHDGLLR